MTLLTQAAPAKLNLTLEAIGLCPDGFHEIRSVMTTIDLTDDLFLESGAGLIVQADEEYEALGFPMAPGELNTVETALAIMVSERLRLQGNGPIEPDQALLRGLDEVSLRLRKRIPASAGLGGGSSDGVATLRLLNAYWQMQLSDPEIEALSLRIGSDCPFFVRAGCQLLAGRGEVVRPLTQHFAAWFCIVTPPIRIPHKTATLYALLDKSHYSDGRRSLELAERMAGARRYALDGADLCNVFDTVAGQAYGDLQPIRRQLDSLGATTVHLCGSGPSMYGLFSHEPDAKTAQDKCRADGYQAWAVRAPASSLDADAGRMLAPRDHQGEMRA